MFTTDSYKSSSGDHFPNAAVTPAVVDIVPSHIEPKDPQQQKQQQAVAEEEELLVNCRFCNSTDPLFVDWAQGDRICTKCGAVNEERICDSRAEWKEFHDADDLAKGLPAAARCGMVPVDESRYIGGLQPTTLSAHVFGGGVGHDNIPKRLVATNRRMDRIMEKLHNNTLKNARLSRKIARKRLLDRCNRNNNNNCDEATANESDLDSEMMMTYHEDIPPEYDKLLLQEEEDFQRAQAALNADKWSLQRAILLHGSGEESSLYDSGSNFGIDSRDALIQRLDNTLQKAALDLYCAYSMLQQAARTLRLPDRVTNEATTMLCQYAARRDGFVVKGVSSRLSIKGDSSCSKQRRNEALQRLREHNSMKQMGALCSALLFLTAKNLGWTRSLVEVCTSVQPQLSKSSGTISTAMTAPFIKSKHCSRAIDEIKAIFPDYVHRPASTVKKASDPKQEEQQIQLDHIATANFVDHSLRKLQLPPVAEASIRALVGHCRREQIQKGMSSGTKLSTICASLAYFVCVAGSVMQRLAMQAQRNQPQNTTNLLGASFPGNVKNGVNAITVAAGKTMNNGKNERKRSRSAAFLDSDNSNGLACGNMDSVGNDLSSKKLTKKENKYDVCPVKKTKQKSLVDNSGHREEEEEQQEEEKREFDVFTHDASTEVESAENREYEMRRVWDTWANQMPWFRTLGDVENSCGVAAGVVLEYYKSTLYPRRQKLLEVLRRAVAEKRQKQKSTTASGGVMKNNDNNNNPDSTNDAADKNNDSAEEEKEYKFLVETPLASTLLSHVCVAGSIMQRQIQKTSCL